MTARILTLLGSALFVFYCTAVGVYLLLHPWFPLHRAAIGLPGSGYFRGFVSGLGLVHLVAGLSDVRALARSFDAPSPAAVSDPPEGAPATTDSVADESRASGLP